MAVRTRSSRRPTRNGPAAASLLVGLVAAASLPAAVALAELDDRYDLLQACWAVPAALGLGLAALLLARRARVRVERTLGRVGGVGRARVGRALGVLGIMLGVSGAIAVGVYLALTRFFE